jgi:uncharacterized membrane protein
MERMNENRVNSIDILRGIAIMIMILANAWPSLYPFDTCPSSLRIIFSTAAPVFIFLSGYSVSLAVMNKKNTLQIVARALQIGATAAGLDMLIWGIVPFITFDVLYLISFSILCILVMRKINPYLLLIISIPIMFTNQLFMDIYDHSVEEINLSGIFQSESYQNSIQHFLIDGWFPVFPWLGMALIGYVWGTIKKWPKNYNLLIFTLGTVLIIFASFNSSDLLGKSLRNGYAELFYPMNQTRIMFVLGTLMTLAPIISMQFPDRLYPAKWGKLSLSIYVFHVTYIHFILPFFAQEENDFKVIILLAGIILFYLTIVIFVELQIQIKARLKHFLT